MSSPNLHTSNLKFILDYFAIQGNISIHSAKPEKRKTYLVALTPVTSVMLSEYLEPSQLAANFEYLDLSK